MAINKKTIFLDLDGDLNKYNGEYKDTYIVKSKRAFDSLNKN